ncbi:nucleotidyltransferase [Zunongwangia sp. H14]|uniref:nucleotidyltransferase domain-containing protein n=1 Tax=Zunongwangia sp. H14 TaxID=3240792 RepID=UPI003564D714
MAIPEAQLQTWSNQGATITSTSTYNSIKACIDNNNWNEEVRFNIYLQGSYRNFTNIRGDSDVDVVVEFSSVFYSNKYELPSEQLNEFNQYYSDGKFSLASFKAAVIERLKDYYGENYVKVGNNSIKVLANSGRLECDVICCGEYREYNSFSKTNTSDYSKGIVFWTNETNEKVVNFPKLHFENGASKNINCNSNYKPSIRIIKNIKSRLVSAGIIDSSLAPSYFIEGLLFNIPNSNFLNTTHRARVLAILNTFYNYDDSELQMLICQNKQRYLFGQSNQQWDIEDCKQLRYQLIKYWNDYT